MEAHYYLNLFYDTWLIVAESISPFHRFTVSVKEILSVFAQEGVS